MKKYFLFLFSFVFLFSITPVRAQRIFSDDFSGNLEKWQLVNGDISYWQVSNQALYATIAQSRKLSTIVPKDEFWQGMDEYTVDFIFKVFDDTDKNFVIGMRDVANFYDFHFYSNKLIVEDIRNGFSLHSAMVPFALELNRDYSVHVFYAKEKIELLIDGEKVFNTTENWAPPIYGGKFGLKIATGGVAHSRAFFDQVEVKEINSKDVLFKQDDPLWAMAIYDHADSWTDHPEMSNWACALNSVAMLLRAYGYYSLPNGDEINPLSLNQWLIEQGDGYIANGLVNWLAISRLSRILSEQSADILPKLEFIYFKGSEEENLGVLRESLVETAGQIAASFGHFFLVKEYLENLHDFSIKDPLYGQLLLSEKTEKIVSLRLFQPSFTDLSYLLLVLPKEFNFSLTAENGGVIEELQSVEEEITGELGTIGQDYRLIYYAKPESAKLNLSLNTSNLNKELLDKVKLFIYQNDGDFQLVSLSGLINEAEDFNKVNQLLLKIDYLKEEESIVNLEIIEKTIDEQKQNTLNQLAAKSNEDFESGRISFYLFYQLNLLIDSLREHLDYFFLLQKFLDFHKL